MAERHLIKAILGRFKRMPASERIEKVRKLAAESKGTKEFIRSEFPDLYKEAFNHRRPAAGGLSESARPHELSAKRH